MDQPGVQPICQAVVAAIQKEKNGYVNIKALITGFPAGIKQSLGFEKTVKNKNFTAKEALDRLGPHLNKKVLVYQKGTLIYLSLDSKENMILRKLRQAKSSPTFKMLRKKVTPLLNDIFTQTLNGLLRTGTIQCRFKGDNPVLSLSDSASDQPFEPIDPVKDAAMKKETAAPDDSAAFQTALNAVGKGRRLVYIYKVRRHLKWSRNRFDKLIRKLRGEYQIQLHGGDPSVMTEDQVRDSFMDEKGVLHISISWWAK